MLKSEPTHAIVIGAGMGGLIAARVLADHYARVTILERDALPSEPEPRKGVPHGRHVHLLLARGREVLEELFPGLTAELVGAGAVLAGLSETIVHVGGVYLAQGDSHLRNVLSSRPLLEAHVRRSVCAHPRVAIRERSLVQALLADRDRVCGVQLAAASAGEPPARLGADLVVDASGRHTRAPDWVSALGYERPAEETIGVRIGYATRLFQRRPEHLGGNCLALVRPDAPVWRFGLAIAIEHDRWMVTLGGYLDDRPAEGERGFLDFARSLAAPDIANLVSVAEPLGPLTNFVFPESRRWRYDRLSHFPRGYLVFADALCSLNPAYGQGMTAAALEGLTLRECLAQGDAHLAPRFFARSAAIVDAAWRNATGGDLQLPHLAHLQLPATRSARLMRWYRRRTLQAAATDPAVGDALLRVMNLIDAPRQLLSPATMSRVLLAHLRRTDEAALNSSHGPQRTVRQAT